MDKGASAPQTGPSQAEPKVSALRASVPCAERRRREARTYRGWTIRRGIWPEPAWTATGPNYDAWTEGEGEWADNGEKADARNLNDLISEIDAWFEENEMPNETAWLVEMVEPETNRPPVPRWWHPEHGWMWEAGKALRFAREQDAADYIRFIGGGGLHGKASEHVFVDAASGIAARSDETATQAQPEGQEPGPQGDAHNADVREKNGG